MILQADLPLTEFLEFQRRMVENLAEWNMAILHRYHVPPLYRSGVKYRLEKASERYRDIIRVWGSGYGDCEDLVAWRLAELWNSGQPASPIVTVTVTNPDVSHVAIDLGNGRVEDPSLYLS